MVKVGKWWRKIEGMVDIGILEKWNKKLVLIGGADSDLLNISCLQNSIEKQGLGENIYVEIENLLAF